jgi:hypothetical protein
LVSCGIETLAKERHKQTGQLPAPSQSWKDGHQYQLNIKQEDLKVYDRIQTNSSNQYHSCPATLVSS